VFSENIDQAGRSPATAASECPRADQVFVEEHVKPPEAYSPECPSPTQLRTDLQSAQEDTTQFEAMRKALEAREIQEDQNPCTYPAALRQTIGLSAAQCAGQLGRMLARQYD
jgi:hypothetical protein